MGPFAQPQWSAWPYAAMEDAFSPYNAMSSYSSYLSDSMETYQSHNRNLVHQHMSRATESKPRLSKDEVEVLEAEFQKNHKPSSSTKKALAESMRVDNARINNWFQNRRAREKKENNIREYEARQRLEKEKAEAEAGSQPDAGKQCDLVASSAPFPQVGAGSRPRAPAARSPSPTSTLDVCSESTEPSQVADSASPSLSTPHTRPATPSSVSFSGSIDLQASASSMGRDLSEQADSFYNMSDMCSSDMNGSHLLPVDAKTPALLFDDVQAFLGSGMDRPDLQAFDLDFAAATTSALPPQYSPVSDDSLPISPLSSGSSSRHSRRPPPLATGDCRSHSYYTPRNSMDVDKREERAKRLRRVASSTGASKIKRLSVTPHSPFYDATVNLTLQTSHLGGMACPTGSRAPPTPDTPAALHQQTTMDGTLQRGLDRKFMPADLVFQDPTLRTPPTTPGFLESLFGMGSGYDMSISEEALISPAVATMPGGFDMPTVTGDMSDFVGPGSVRPSQQPASLLPSQMGHAFMGGNFLGSALAGGYDWSEATTPTISSPGLPPRQSY